jgi:transcriptional regulator with XRE-family HTH domain
MISATQSKMARAALGWSIREAAEHAGLGVATVARFEAGIAQPTKANLAAMRRAYEHAGIAFIDDDEGSGIKLAKGIIR